MPAENGREDARDFEHRAVIHGRCALPEAGERRRFEQSRHRLADAPEIRHHQPTPRSVTHSAL